MEQIKAAEGIGNPGESAVPPERTVSPETRIALVGIIVEEPDAAARLNAILHDYGQYIIGRMGIPYHPKKINIISVVVDGPADVISSLAGKLGMVRGISVKTVYSKV